MATRTERAEAIADAWLQAEYSEAHKLSQTLSTQKRAGLRAALVTAALTGITSQQAEATK